MLKILVENTNLDRPVAGVRWCLDREMLEKLKQLELDNLSVYPFILFVIAHKGTGGYQPVNYVKAVPISQAMEYLEFRRPGEHIIHACIVSVRGPDFDLKSMKDLGRYLEALALKSLFLRREIIINSVDGHVNLADIDSTSVDFLAQAPSVSVVVPEGFFGKEPAAWERWWVNLWYETNPRDPCHFRKRRILAYSIQPPAVAMFIIIKTLLGAGQLLLNMLCGRRNLRYSALLHPFSYSVQDWDLISDNSSSIFITDSSDRERNLVFFFLMPMFQIVLFFLAVLIKLFMGLLFGLGGSIWIWFAVTILLALTFLAVVYVLDNFLPEKKSIKTEVAVNNKYKEYEDLVCFGDSTGVSVAALPAKRRTLYLRFKEFKYKVCLPYADRNSIF